MSYAEMLLWSCKDSLVVLSKLWSRVRLINWGLRNYGCEGQIGQEDTPEKYVANMVNVFREVRRVLRDDGTAWVNLADTFTSSRQVPHGLKPKDLVGIPWRVAFALQADGWYLRSDIIWAKDIVQPESVQDRPTRSHEYVFLLTKKSHYFYDVDAIREGPNGRNRRTVWTLNPTLYRGTHFATFPEELPSICIKAGTSAKGACPTCSAPWKRLVERSESTYAKVKGNRHWTELQSHAEDMGWVTRGGPTLTANGTMPSLRATERVELGWAPTCEHGGEPVPCLVLDPFAGSGTTLAVAKYLGRDYVGIELNPEYGKLIEGRLRPASDYDEAKGIMEFALSLGDDE